MKTDHLSLLLKINYIFTTAILINYLYHILTDLTALSIGADACCGVAKR